MKEINVRAVARLLGHTVIAVCTMLMACMAPAQAQDIGPADGQPLTILIPLAPSLLDGQQHAQPAVIRWLTHISQQAHVQMRLQVASFDRRIAETSRSPNTCILGLARRPDR